METITAKPAFTQRISYAVIFAGFVLSLVQYLYNRSLWMDEAALALDIIHDNSAMLLKGLANGQVAPILYLQMEHLFTLLLPKSEYGLRLFPLLCYWTSLMLFYKALRCIFSDGYIILFALSLYVFDGAFIYYSSEVKQYITDVMVVNAILYFAIKSYKSERNRYVFLAFAGMLAIGFSNISAIILACTGAYLLVEYTRRKEYFKYLVGTFAIWAITFGIYYKCFIYNHPLKQLMLAYWTKTGGFMPLNSHLPAWVANKFISNFYFQFGFGKVVCIILMILFFAGMVYLIKKKSAMGLILLLPLPLHILLSGFKLYPFDTRLVLYLTPLLIISIAWGMYGVLQILPLQVNKTTIIILQVITPVLLCVLLVLQSFPLVRHDDLRQCVSFMKTHETKSDDVYVSMSAKYPMEFYHDISYYSAQRIIIGQYTPSVISSARDDRKQLGKLSSRVWVYCLKPYHEDNFINNLLLSEGYMPSSSFIANGNAAVCLYTLKSVARHLKPVAKQTRLVVKS